MKKENKYYRLASATFGPEKASNCFDVTDIDVSAATSNFTPKELTIINKRFIDNETMRDVAKELDISAQRVRQVESKALRKLRHPSRSCYFMLGKDGVEKKAKDMEKEAEERKEFVDSLDASDPRSIDIGSVGFSVRTNCCLQRGGVKTLYDLTLLTEKDILSIRNIGTSCVEEIKNKLAQYGLSIKG